MAYRLNRLDQPVFMAVSKPLLTELGIHPRLESCEGKLVIANREGELVIANNKQGKLVSLPATASFSLFMGEGRHDETSSDISSNLANSQGGSSMAGTVSI